MLRMLLIGMAMLISGPGAAQQVIQGKPIVLEGATLLFGRTQVDLWGIDAPTLRHWPLGVYSRAALGEIVGDKTIRCASVEGEFQARVVALCGFLEASDSFETLGLLLLKSGWGATRRDEMSRASHIAEFYALDIIAPKATLDYEANDSRPGGPLLRAYILAEEAARREALGIWANPILPPGQGADFIPGIPGSTAEDPLGLFAPETGAFRKR